MKKSLLGLVAVGILALAGVGYLAFRRGGTAPTMSNSTMLNPGTDAHVDAQEVEYYSEVRGYYAAPKAPGAYPGVIMVHEWWGLNDGIKEMARNLAAEGYAVLAVDLYHGKVAKDATEARALTQSIVASDAIANMKAARSYLRAQGASKLAALGWCFGGGQVMQYSLSGDPLDASVIYYGQLETDAKKLASITWPVLGIFGDKDTSVTPESARAFDAALTEAKVQHSVHIYPGVGHAFANPSGANYAANEARDAWEKTLRFLDEALR